VVDGDDSAHRDFIRSYVTSGDAARPVADAAGGCRRASTRDDHPTRDPGNGLYKLIDDPRITPVGRWLRKTSLDEIAQMINVLRGEMSIVGPRPPVLYEYGLYRDYHKQRLAVLPGITGLAQVRARSRASFEEMVEIDLEYIRDRSVWGDLAIIAQTVWVVLSGRGAH
jgi:lipopolysaccharide/colanic/teichoic acid biosynthesis glycosyltransferase